jgi:predicted nucleic acid-binding protein
MQTLFLDSNILLEGMRSRWGLSKAVLSLCAARIHQLVLAQHVISEVEGALLVVLQGESADEASELLADYFTFIDKAQPVIVPLAAIDEITAAARIIHHLNDAPVLATQ